MKRDSWMIEHKPFADDRSQPEDDAVNFLYANISFTYIHALPEMARLIFSGFLAGKKKLWKMIKSFQIPSHQLYPWGSRGPPNVMVGWLLICGQPIFGQGGCWGVRCGGGKYSPGILLVTQIINVSPPHCLPLANPLPSPTIFDLYQAHQFTIFSVFMNMITDMQCHFVNGVGQQGKVGNTKVQLYCLLAHCIE